MPITKEVASLLDRYRKLVAKRAETNQALAVALEESDRTASALTAERSNSAVGSASRERTRKLTTQFDEADHGVRTFEQSLAGVNREIVRLEPEFNRAWAAATDSLWAEFLREYTEGALAFLGICRRAVAYRSLGRELPYQLEKLLIPDLNASPTRPLSELIPQKWVGPAGGGFPYQSDPQWDQVAEERLQELLPLQQAFTAVQAEAKVAREQERQLLVTSKAVERSNREHGVGQAIPIPIAS